MMLKRKIWSAILAISSLSLAQRICVSPDALFVDSSSLRSLNIFIYVPSTTSTYTLGVFDQTDDEGIIDQPSSFVLYAPDGSPVQQLNNPRQGEWSDYEIDVKGRWGVWRLTVSGPKPPSGQGQIARNNFLVRTLGEVDPYIKLEPRARMWFSPPRFGAPPVHSFIIQVPPLNRLRLNFIRPPQVNIVQVQLEAPKEAQFLKKWGGLGRGNPEFLEVSGGNLQGLWKLTISDVRESYALGIEQELRIFFTDSPLMENKYVILKTVGEDGKTPLPARADISSPQTRLESYVVYTGLSGSSYIALLPDTIYTITVSRGFEYEPYTLLATADETILTAYLRKVLTRPKGWYCGDTHMHTIYSDGNDTPLQMAEAGLGEGLDFIVLTDHGAGPNIQHILTAHQEGMVLSQPNRFLVIPGEEFSVSTYHANIINGTVKELGTVSLHQLVRSIRKMSTQQRPLSIKLNHPYWSGTPKAPEVASETPLLPLLELWNDDPSNEPRSAYLLWELLNRGWKVFGDTATDTHNRKTYKVGARRTYVYLGDLPLTAENVTRSLSEGHTFLSRGALLFFSVEGRIAGEQVVLGKEKQRLKLTVDSISPIDRLELINNGKVVHTIPVGGAKRFSVELSLPFEAGWVLAQVLEKDTIFPLAMTNPIFLIATH